MTKSDQPRKRTRGISDKPLPQSSIYTPRLTSVPSAPPPPPPPSSTLPHTPVGGEPLIDDVLLFGQEGRVQPLQRSVVAVVGPHVGRLLAGAHVPIAGQTRVS